MSANELREIAYLLAAALFIYDLKWMAHPRTAVRGNWIGALGMAIAIAATVVGLPRATPGRPAGPDRGAQDPGVRR